ncbi:hypothetical protein [Thalassovita sp.]|uniref:hypothetical protein n=1 Tax=Thalassovita sp. TaxID=1979401 RepID=UPI002B268CB5|nr:hypothetical protein [Thalassovita sp.]
MTSFTKFYSYSRNDLDFTIWRHDGRFLLTEQNENLGHHETLDDAIKVAVEGKKLEGVNDKILEDLANLDNWTNGLQVLSGAE